MAWILLCKQSPLKSRFKCSESPLQFPLLVGLFAGLQKIGAARRELLCARRILRANRNSASENIRRAPQTRTRQKTMFQAGAHNLLEIAVVQPVSLHRAYVLVRQVDPRNALIVR